MLNWSYIVIMLYCFLWDRPLFLSKKYFKKLQTKLEMQWLTRQELVLADF